MSSISLTHSFTRFIRGRFEAYSVVLLWAAFCLLLSSSLGESPADFWFLGMRYLSKPFLRKNYTEWLFSQWQIFMWRLLFRQAVFLIEHDWAKQKYPHSSHPLSQPKTSETKENIVNIVLLFCRPVAREKSHLKECCCPGVRVTGILMSVWVFSLTDLLCVAACMSVAFLTVPSKARSIPVD